MLRQQNILILMLMIVTCTVYAGNNALNLGLSHGEIPDSSNDGNFISAARTGNNVFVAAVNEETHKLKIYAGQKEYGKTPEFKELDQVFHKDTDEDYDHDGDGRNTLFFDWPEKTHRAYERHVSLHDPDSYNQSIVQKDVEIKDFSISAYSEQNKTSHIAVALNTTGYWSATKEVDIPGGPGSVPIGDYATSSLYFITGIVDFEKNIVSWEVPNTIWGPDNYNPYRPEDEGKYPDDKDVGYAYLTMLEPKADYAYHMTFFLVDDDLYIGTNSDVILGLNNGGHFQYKVGKYNQGDGIRLSTVQAVEIPSGLRVTALTLLPQDYEDRILAWCINENKSDGNLYILHGKLGWDGSKAFIQFEEGFDKYFLDSSLTTETRPRIKYVSSEGLINIVYTNDNKDDGKDINADFVHITKNDTPYTFFQNYGLFSTDDNHDEYISYDLVSIPETDETMFFFKPDDGDIQFRQMDSQASCVNLGENFEIPKMAVGQNYVLLYDEYGYTIDPPVNTLLGSIDFTGKITWAEEFKKYEYSILRKDSSICFDYYGRMIIVRRNRYNEIEYAVAVIDENGEIKLTVPYTGLGVYISESEIPQLSTYTSDGCVKYFITYRKGNYEIYLIDGKIDDAENLSSPISWNEPQYLIKGDDPHFCYSDYSDNLKKFGVLNFKNISDNKIYSVRVTKSDDTGKYEVCSSAEQVFGSTSKSSALGFGSNNEMVDGFIFNAGFIDNEGVYLKTMKDPYFDTGSFEDMVHIDTDNAKFISCSSRNDKIYTSFVIGSQLYIFKNK